MSPYSLHASLGYQMTVTVRLQEKRFEDWLKDLGLTRTSWCVLVALDYEGLTRPSDIASFIGIDRTAISRTLRQMEAAGLIARSSGTGDKRTTEVATTKTGQEALARAAPIAKKNAALIEENLSEAETTELRRLLAKIRGDAPLTLDRI